LQTQWNHLMNSKKSSIINYHQISPIHSLLTSNLICVTLELENVYPHTSNIVLIDNQKDIYLNLPPLLFAILYDKLTTLGTPTSESTWTISRLSPSLSSLSPVYLPPQNIPSSQYPPLKQIKIAFFRRVLTYPLYRHLPLAENLWNLVAQCIASKRAVLRILLDTREIFMDGDWSVYNRIIWDDYLVWTQGCRESVLKVLADQMRNTTIDIRELGFDLQNTEMQS
jgi:protein SHQ1